jgi:hypothetical protein
MSNVQMELGIFTAYLIEFTMLSRSYSFTKVV